MEESVRILLILNLLTIIIIHDILIVCSESLSIDPSLNRTFIGKICPTNIIIIIFIIHKWIIANIVVHWTKSKISFMSCILKHELFATFGRG